MPRSTTKRLRMIYVNATFLFLVLQGYDATEYLAQAPGVLESFGSFGYSGRVLQILGGAKVLGIVLLALAPSVPLKHLIHYAFALTAVGALVSHLSAYDPIPELVPVVALLVVQLVAYSAWQLWLRRLAARRRLYYLEEGNGSAIESHP